MNNEMPKGFMEGVQEGLEARAEGRVRPLRDVLAELDATLPPEALLTDEELSTIEDEDVKGFYSHNSAHLIRAVADSQLAKAWPIAYAAGQASRDQEVADLTGKKWKDAYWETFTEFETYRVDTEAKYGDLVETARVASECMLSDPWGEEELQAKLALDAVLAAVPRPGCGEEGI